MTPEKDAALCAKYPKIFAMRHGDMRETAMCWGFEHGDGWYDLIDRLCEKLQEISDRVGHQVVATQVKEKFGGLRFYVGPAHDEHFVAINDAENESYKICEKCGASPAKTTQEGWMSTRCKEHWPKDEPWVD